MKLAHAIAVKLYVYVPNRKSLEISGRLIAKRHGGTEWQTGVYKASLIRAEKKPIQLTKIYNKAGYMTLVARRLVSARLAKALGTDQRTDTPHL